MRSFILLAAAAALTTGALAQTKQDHATHHPDGASAPAAAAKEAPTKANAATTAKGKTRAPAGSAGTGMGMASGKDNMKDMHDQMHKPGGMHDQMHGKDAKTMGGQLPPPTPPSSAGSK